MLLGRRSGRELGHGSPRGRVGSCSVGWPQGPGPCCAQGRLGGHGALPRDRPSPRPPAGPLAPVPTGGLLCPGNGVLWSTGGQDHRGGPGVVAVWGQEGKMAAEIVGADREGPWRGAVAGDRRSPKFTGCKLGAQGGAVTPVFLQAGGDSSQSPPRHRPRGQPGASARETRPPVALGPAGDPGGRLLTPGGTLSCLLPVLCQDHVGPGVSVQGGRLGVRPSSRPIPPSASLTVTGNGLTKP